MTKVIKILIDDKADTMLKDLQDIGFTPDQAGMFLAETSDETLNVLKDNANKFGFTTASEIGLISMLMDKIDPAAIGARLGIDSDFAKNGLQTIVPPLVNTLSSRANMAEVVAAITAQRGLMHKIKGMFGNVSGK